MVYLNFNPEYSSGRTKRSVVDAVIFQERLVKLKADMLELMDEFNRENFATPIGANGGGGKHYSVAAILSECIDDLYHDDIRKNAELAEHYTGE